jgi:hypothetical protein
MLRTSAQCGPLVELRRLGGPSPLRQCVTVPPTERAPATFTPHARRSLLVEFDSGNVWFFRMPVGYTPGQDTLAAAARICREAGSVPRGTPFAARRLRDELDTRLDGDAPLLGPRAPELFAPRGLALELALGACLGGGAEDIGRRDVAEHSASCPSALARAIGDIEARVRAELLDALGEFLAGLDQGLAGLARVDGGLDAQRYNYLLGGDVVSGRNRRQFAGTFPFLIDAALSGDNDTCGVAGLLRAVDQGVPIVRYLAGAYGVRGSAVRHLLGKSLSEVGAPWRRVPGKLLRVLDLVPPELRPRDAAGWQSLNSAVQCAEELFGQPADSPVVGAWLSEQARTGFRSGDHTGMTALRDQAPLVHEFCASLEQCLRRRAAEELGGQVVDAEVLPRTLAIGVATSRRWPATIDLAARWQRTVAECAAERAALCRLRREHFLPLIPAPMICGDRVIVPLVTQAQLDAEGRAMQHCVADYGEICASGSCFIVSVRHSLHGPCASTAEFALTRTRSGMFQLVCMQHRAKRDERPGAACRKAVAALLEESRSQALQLHFRKLEVERDALRAPPVGGEVALWPMEEAFRRALRPRGSYDRLVRTLLDELRSRVHVLPRA